MCVLGYTEWYWIFWIIVFLFCLTASLCFALAVQGIAFFPLHFAWMLDSRRYDIATFSFAYLLLFQFVHRVISWKYFCSFFFAKTSRIERRKGVVFLSSVKIMMKKKTCQILTKLTLLMLLLKMLYIFFCFDIYSFLKERAKIVWYSFRRASKELTWLKSR